MTRRYAAAGIGVSIVIIVSWLSFRGGSTAKPALRFAYQNRVGSALCIVAAEKGLFGDQGLTIRTFRFNSGPACSEALYSGSVDIATMGDTTAVIAVSRGEQYRIIASHGGGEHRHRIVVPQDSPIGKLEELAGKRLAVRKGTSTYGGLLAFCARHVLDIKAIQAIDMRPSEMTEALLAGSIDAFVASEPTPSLAEARGAQELATLGGLGNHYPILVVARRDWLQERPEEVRRFLAALRRAEAFVREHSDATAELIAHVTGLPMESAKRAMGRHEYRLLLDDRTKASLRRTAEFLHAQGLIDAIPDLDKVAETRWLLTVE